MYVTAKKTVSATKFTAIRNGLLIHEQAKELLNQSGQEPIQLNQNLPEPRRLLRVSAP